MALTHAERVMSRRQVKAMVKGDAEMVVLTRIPMVEDGEGGFYEGGPVDLEPQRMAILPFKKRLVNGILVTEFGQVPGQDKTLLAEVGVDIKIGDTLLWRGDTYTVAEFEPILADMHTMARLNMLGGVDIHAN